MTKRQGLTESPPSDPAERTAEPEAPAGPSRATWGSRNIPGVASDILSRYGLIAVWLAMIAIYSIIEPSVFLTVGNFQNIFGSQAQLLILAIAILIPSAAGEFDLSVAGVMGVSLVLVGELNVLHHWPIALAVAVAMASGLVVGLINSFFVVIVGVASIVVTLGTGTLLYGIASGINIETTGGVSPVLVHMVRYSLFGLPMIFYYALILTAGCWYFFRYLPAGRFIYFVGAGRETSRLAGIRVGWVRAGALIASSCISAFAGVVLAGWLGASDPSISPSYLLPAFAAVFLGATTITPGRFNPIGTFVAVYFLITGITGLELLGYVGWIEQVFYGASLVGAVSLSTFIGAHRRSGVGRLSGLVGKGTQNEHKA